MVFEKRDSTGDSRAGQGRVQQMRRVQKDRLRRRLFGERGPCRFPMEFILDQKPLLPSLMII